MPMAGMTMAILTPELGTVAGFVKETALNRFQVLKYDGGDNMELLCWIAAKVIGSLQQQLLLLPAAVAVS